MVKTVGIVSLSHGILGETFVKHELEIGIKRLENYGLRVKFLPSALKGIEYLDAHPEKRAEDLLLAFRDPEIDMILCAIGGYDTYRLLPYLFDGNELRDAVTEKILLGFSDTTVNHFMLHKVGLRSFYGQSFLADICELDHEMLPYSKKYFEELISSETIREVTPSDVWYESRSAFGAEQVGTPLPMHRDNGFELLQGKSKFSGKILGGCIDSIFDMLSSECRPDMSVLCRKYELFPEPNDWRGKILLLESSEEKMPPEKYQRALSVLKSTGIFDALSGVLIGKPMDRAYEAEYKRLLVETIDIPDLPIVCNVNIGHALPRCIIPFGVDAVVSTEEQKIVFGDLNATHEKETKHEKITA